MIKKMYIYQGNRGRAGRTGVVALPEETLGVTEASADVSVQAVDAQIGGGASEPLHMHRALTHVKVEAHVVLLPLHACTQCVRTSCETKFLKNIT